LHDAGCVGDGMEIDHGQATPGERGLVHLDRGAVEFDRAHDRFERQRHQSLLPGIAKHEQVGGDCVADQRGRQLRGIHQQRLLAGERGAHRGDDVGGGEFHVGARGEGAWHRLVGVEHDAGAVGADLRQRPVVVDHDHVAAEHEVGFTGGDAHRVDVGRRFGDADMGGDRAAFLRQPGLVEHAGTAPFQMPGHAQQRANRDHASAADAGDQDVPGLRQIGGEGRQWNVREFFGGVDDMLV
jgi:hypothetical protein